MFEKAANVSVTTLCFREFSFFCYNTAVLRNHSNLHPTSTLPQYGHCHAI